MTTPESSADEGDLTLVDFTTAAMNAAQALLEALPYTDTEWSFSAEDRKAIDLLALKSRNAATAAFLVSCGVNAWDVGDVISAAATEAGEEPMCEDVCVEVCQGPCGAGKA
jgi:hypothetical protein